MSNFRAARERDGLPAVAADETHGRFLQMATVAMSDSFRVRPCAETGVWFHSGWTANGKWFA